jgi:hypothetical protein
MRYHWGLAVGHVYTHGQTAAMVKRHQQKTMNPSASSVQCDLPLGMNEDATSTVIREDESDVDQHEFVLRRHDDDDWEVFSEDEEISEDFSDDDIFVAMDDMYGVVSGGVYQ